MKSIVQDSNKSLTGYSNLLRQMKQRVLLAQQRAVFAANEELLRLYWDLGHMLCSAQQAEGWGKGTLNRLSEDMKNEYPKEKGFSVRNFQFMMQFYEEYNQELTMVRYSTLSIAKQPVSQLNENTNKLQEYAIAKQSVSQLTENNFVLPVRHLSWAHNVVLMQRVKDIKARYWYMIQCLTSHWGRDFLIEAIKLDYYGQHGAVANNFDYELGQALPNDLRSSLPSIEDLEAEFENIDYLSNTAE